MASTSASDAAIIAGWKTALNAFDTAERTGNWLSSALPATYAQPLLRNVQDNLRLESADNEAARGRDRILTATVAVVARDSASLIACVQGDEIIVDSATGQAVPGVLGQSGLERFNATFIRLSTAWKVETQTISEGACAP